MINYNTCTTSGVNEALVNQRQQKSSWFAGRTELTVTVTVNTNREAPESEGTKDGCRSCVTAETMMWNTNRMLIVSRVVAVEMQTVCRSCILLVPASGWNPTEAHRLRIVMDLRLRGIPTRACAESVISLGQWKRREQLVPDHWARYDMASDT